ncbi:MAG: T9SS C-terminal target domain-containing protein [Chitinophagia bacterium]|nr:T9SS C-terminal target domain-containing protein [Chitinophagia bacterium]
MAREQAYQMLWANNSLLDSSRLLNQFFTEANRHSRYGWLHSIRQAIDTGNYTQAATLLSDSKNSYANTLVDTATGLDMADGTDANSVVDNYLTYLNVLLHYQTDEVTKQDSNNIKVLAYKCASVEGAVVYQAQALHDLVWHTNVIFPTGSCDSEALAAGKDSRKVAVKQADYTLYPNPNTGSFTVQTSTLNALLDITVTNQLGATVYHQEAKVTNGKTTVNLNQVAPDIYLVKIKDAAGNIHYLKALVK